MAFQNFDGLFFKPDNSEYNHEKLIEMTENKDDLIYFQSNQTDFNKTFTGFIIMSFLIEIIIMFLSISIFSDKILIPIYLTVINFSLFNILIKILYFQYINRIRSKIFARELEDLEKDIENEAKKK